MSESRLFEDDLALESALSGSSIAPELLAAEEQSCRSRYRFVTGVAIVGVIAALLFTFATIPNDRSSLTLSGAQVGQLRPGATLVLDGQTVGAVDEVQIRKGVPSARLRMDPEIVARIPYSSRFEVGSINRLLPDNVGVKILTSSENNTSPRVDLRSKGERLAGEPVLAERTAPGFYLVLFAIVLAGILVLGFVIKLVKSASFWTAVLVALFIVALHAWYSGELNEAARWGQEHLGRTLPTQRVFP